MSLYCDFLALPAATTAVDFSAIPLSKKRKDFLAKALDGSPVFLVEDSSSYDYSPSIELKYISVQFHARCRVIQPGKTLEGRFAVISCDVGSPELHEVFVKCISAVLEKLAVDASSAELKSCINNLLALFRVLSKPTGREIAGLWGELFLIIKSKDLSKVIQAWHASYLECFDFSWPNGCLEVKTTTKEVRQHEFALEQLSAPQNGVGLVASIMLQPMSGGVGVIDLASQIDAKISGEPELKNKLWRLVVEALGADFSERLDQKYSFSYSEKKLLIFSMSDIPMPEHPNDPRITSIRFQADLTSVVSSFSADANESLSGLVGI